MTSDPHFPQMADALNPALMEPLLRWRLNIPGVHPGKGGCSIGEKRYKPGKSLVISYRLDAQQDIMNQPRHATGRLCPPGEARTEFERERARRPELVEGALTFLDEPAMLLWAFPYDRKLVHLPQLLDANLIPVQLTPKLKALGVDSPDRILSVSSEVLHYLPERSCMIRFRIEYSVPSADARHTVLVYGKNYADDAGAEVFVIMRQLRGQFTWGAQVLAYDSEKHTLWQSHVPGSPLCWADLISDTGPAIAGRIGFCVAQFHACSLNIPTRYTQDDVEQGLLATIEIAGRTRPELGERVRRAVVALLSADQLEPESVMVPIHHDLKLNNFLIDGRSIGLIDMDCVCLGNPLTDLASLIANLYLNGLREGECAERIHPLANRLVRTYRASSVYVVSLRRLRWHVAAALIHEVTRRSLRQLDSRRMAYIQAYLDLSDTYAASSHGPGNDADELI